MVALISRRRWLGIGLAGFGTLCGGGLLLEMFPNRQMQASLYFGQRGAPVGFRFDHPQWIQDLLSPWRFGRHLLYRTGSLSTIRLKDVSISETDLQHLDNCPRLETLALDGCEVHDDLLRRLPLFKELSHLELSGLSEDDLSIIGQLEHLTWLSLDGPGITDAGLARLQNLQSVESLNLDGTQITDASIPQLCELPKLESLYLRRTQVTDEGIARLRDQFPNARIYR